MKRKKEYSISYNYDAVGNRAQKLVDASSSLKELKSGSYDYFYDNDNRLVEEVYQKASSGWGNSWGSCFSWQGKGNKRGHGKIHEEVTSYLYDLNGNLLEQNQGRDSSKFSYDASDNMIMADVPGKKPVAFTFNGDGQRIARFFRGKGNSWGHGKKNKFSWKIDTSFAYSGPEVLAEFDSKGKLNTSYTSGPGIDNLISVTQHKGCGRAKSYFYAADALGSVRKIMDSRGKSVNSYSHSPYGVAYDVREHIKQPYRYTGRRWDPNVGKLWYRSRHYDARMGRFTQADKWAKSKFFPTLFHQYRYVRNKPIIYFDPLGEKVYWIGRSLAGNIPELNIPVTLPINRDYLFFHSYIAIESDDGELFTFGVGQSKLYGELLRFKALEKDIDSFNALKNNDKEELQKWNTFVIDQIDLGPRFDNLVKDILAKKKYSDLKYNFFKQIVNGTWIPEAIQGDNCHSFVKDVLDEAQSEWETLQTQKSEE